MGHWNALTFELQTMTMLQGKVVKGRHGSHKMYKQVGLHVALAVEDTNWGVGAVAAQPQEGFFQKTALHQRKPCHEPAMPNNTTRPPSHCGSPVAVAVAAAIATPLHIY